MESVKVEEPWLYKTLCEAIDQSCGTAGAHAVGLGVADRFLASGGDPADVTIVSGGQSDYPIMLRVDDHFVSFQPKTIGCIELMFASPSAVLTARALATMCDVPDLLDWLSETQGITLMTLLLPAMQADAQGTLESAYRYEEAGGDMDELMRAPIEDALPKLQTFIADYAAAFAASQSVHALH